MNIGRDIVNVYIGQQVRVLREDKGWSAKQFAARIGCLPHEVIQCEEARLRLTPRRVLILALTLGVTVNDLFPKTLEWKE